MRKITADAQTAADAKVARLRHRRICTHEAEVRTAWNLRPDAFVVYSSYASYVNTGYRVVAAGKYSQRDDASAASLQAKAAGFPEAYPTLLRV